MAENQPCFSLAEASALAAEHFDIHGTAVALDSYADQNFKITAASGAVVVLKIANRTQQAPHLALEEAVISHLKRHLPDVQWPTPLPTRGGETMVQVTSQTGARHWLRCVPFVEGELLASVKNPSPRLSRDLGCFFGRVNQALESFSHPHMNRDLDWDLANGADICQALLNRIQEPAHRRRIHDLLERFRDKVTPRLQHLRRSVIHNDGNDYNILVTGNRVSGLIDFGDVVFSHTVNELAILCGYAMLGRRQPLQVAARIVAGYHQAYPLTELELSLLFELILLRMCTSVCQAARALAENPDNPYLGVHLQPTLDALAELETVHPRFAGAVFRAACALEPCPKTPRITAYLEKNRAAFHPVLGNNLLAGPNITFDLTLSGRDYGSQAQRATTADFSRYLFDKMAAAGVAVGLGRYNEDRALYNDPDYSLANTQRRSVHLGIDLYAAAGTPVTAPLAGTVHAVADNAAAGDYGPTLILRHETDQGETFFTLYGHLARTTLTKRHVGDAVAAGDHLADLGDIAENGSWPPHLHFQLITDLLDQRGDYPGIARYHERKVWLSFAPDPNVILNLPPLQPGGDPTHKSNLLAKRRHSLGPNLSLSYREPLHIVRGEGCYLYDAAGRAYLDMVNNVCHVGHCHPHVVAAVQKQLARLNTNTRYLHRNILDYAQRLTATLPGNLSVCFFTCTGSEANDLALRLTRNATGRSDMLVLDAAYHGHTRALIEVSPYKYEGRGGFAQVETTHKLPMPDGFRGPIKHGEPEIGRRYAEQAGPILEQKHNQVAGLIAESLPGCGGQIVLPDSYLHHLYSMVRDAGGLCIADEVQVGFGRVGTAMWGFQTQNVVPDIVTLGKPIGNGFPLAAVITTPDIAATFDNGMEYFNTFGGNPVACAAGLAVLDVLENEQLQNQAHQVGTYLKQGLVALQKQYPLIGEVRGLGLFLGVELVRDPESLAPADREAAEIVERMKARGVLLSVDGPLHNVLKIKPPLVFGQAEADIALFHLEAVLKETKL
ncbi:aminotransferase class III-fold pyridoxal phosphate-dependent enzyme [Acanthopleuribacter pedis]|uniref:Aminotransferase class III-fold pyridoxal phosphate-dependent enzyme n=1 Tax=Acanthopleuribacter pedis TaxID=442870 RepID=A0A8J7QGC0_9BACT|nr:aminotransferase class III-fold pyridoxal phosphate-dependent enzyme [Acanthopleuribacter pedis]MBO1319841.1 aminotransferase class III-fold pyridoxal phosphate-dependent enzyme [Acanthopleuribacter pedis]